MKNSGARPEELLKLRWKDVEIRDYKRKKAKADGRKTDLLHQGSVSQDKAMA